jgi:hypothetical protein
MICVRLRQFEAYDLHQMWIGVDFAVINPPAHRYQVARPSEIGHQIIFSHRHEIRFSPTACPKRPSASAGITASSFA